LINRQLIRIFFTLCEKIAVNKNGIKLYLTQN